MQFFGQKEEIGRFLGQVDLDDPTNLPVGCAALCLNTDFTRDSPGVTCANTRCGNNLAIQGLSKAAITGLQEFVYAPALPGEQSFQMPLLFDLAGVLQREFPVGTGTAVAIPASNFVPPKGAHMLSVQAANQVFAAYSDLTSPLSGASRFSPKTLAHAPFGMKPFGWRWQPSTAVLQGEVCTPPSPANGNGHTYQAQNSGVTGVKAPAFPTDEGGQVVDNGVTWKELTMVLANRLEAPTPPTLVLQPAPATFVQPSDVYVRLTLVNPQGESLPSAAQVVSTSGANPSVRMLTPSLAGLPGWVSQLGVPYKPTAYNVYMVAVPTGSAPPSSSAYSLAIASLPLGSTATLPAAGTGAGMPSACTARVVPGQLPAPDVEPDITRASTSGQFPAGRDVYVVMTYTNSQGETKPGPASSIVNTVAQDGVQVTVSVPEDDNQRPLYSIASIGLYEADVPTGTPAPPSSAFTLVGYYAPGATPLIPSTAAGIAPPTSNTTGPAGNIVADTVDGGVNGTQGYRYTSVCFMNDDETFSGFTAASVVRYAVDEDGWELAAFNVATGPAYVVGRTVNFTTADGTQDGPFFWNGLVNLRVPSQNVVYPATQVSDGIPQSATIFLDNATTSGIFNFTDEYLDDDNDVTDRLRIMAPPSPVRIDYLKTLDRLALTGVPGYTGGALISLGLSDYESYYGDTSAIPLPNDGERCWGVTDKYGSSVYAVREKSGYVLTPTTGDPASWNARQVWGEVGAVGPRAWDSCSKFIIFVDQSGIYKYPGQSESHDLVSKEIPRKWATINWQAASTICVTIDEDTHTVRVQVPTGASTVPNMEICLSYLEGWQNPLHFSPVAQKEIGMDAARRYSFNDFTAYVCKRVRRAIPNPPAVSQSPTWAPSTDGTFYISQLLYGSSAPDGMVDARTPGVFSDNGAGIDWQYETASIGLMQEVCKAEGISLNAIGNGLLFPSFLSARDRVTGPSQRNVRLDMKPVELLPNQHIGIARKVPPKLNEYWRVRFTNGKVPGAWFSLKDLDVYVIPWSGARGSLDR